MRNNKSFRVLESQKAGIRFTNNALSDLNETFLENKKEYAEAQSDITQELINMAGTVVVYIIT